MLPESIIVRELRYRSARVRTREVTLVTTLLDAVAYPADALAELYGTRWRVEEDLKSLKHTMKMDVLKCKKVDGVLEELTMYAIAWTWCEWRCARPGTVGGDGRPDQFRGRAVRWLRGAEAERRCRNWWSTHGVLAGTNPG